MHTVIAPEENYQVFVSSVNVGIAQFISSRRRVTSA